MNKSKKNKYRWVKIVSIVLFFLVLFIFNISSYVNKRVKPFIKKELKNIVKNATNGLYLIDYQDVSVNFLSRSVTIDQVKISTNDTVYQQLIAAQKAPNNRYHIKLNQIKIKNIFLLSMYFRKNVRIKNIEFTNPKVEIINKRFEFNDKPPPAIQSTYQAISKTFKSISVDHINFINAHVKYINQNKPVEEVDSVSNLFVTLKDWLIDKNSANDTTRMYFLKDINLYVNNYRFATPDSMYVLKINGLNVGAASGIVKIKGFEMEPRYAQGEFQKVNGYARDRFAIKMNSIVFKQINFQAYIKNGEILADNMQISNGIISVSNNNSYPRIKKDRTGRFPHQLLQKFNALIRIDSIYLNSVNVSYEEFNRKTQESGKITFENTSGDIVNVTNLPKAKAKNRIMRANLQSDLMGQGKLDIRFDFDLTSKTGDFAYQGELINLDLRKLNKLTRPLGLLQINKGILRRLSFDVMANENVAKGTLNFKYNNLSITLFTRNKDSVSVQKLRFLSLLVNALVLYSDNPTVEGKYILSDISYRRIPSASFFSFIWKSLFQGIKYSVGLSPKMETHIKTELERLKQMKRERLNRKINRKKMTLLKRKNSIIYLRHKKASDQKFFYALVSNDIIPTKSVGY